MSASAEIALGRLAELERTAYVDELTGLANRRYAEISLRSRIEELQLYGWLQNSVWSFDFVSRWGGKEYVVVIANVEGNELTTTENDADCSWYSPMFR